MAAVIGALRAELSATIAKFQEDMKKAGASVREFATKAEATGKRLQRVGAQMTVALTAPLVAFGVKAVQAATESAQALGQLDAALKSTEHQAGRTLKQLQAQAKALESISTFDDDDILKDVTTNLTKFGNVVGEVFDKAQLAIVNMASRTGDLAGAAQTVGRALNDPINGINALTRAGVQFTNQEKEKIKALVVSGQGIEAQAIILQKLETAYDGAAKALRDATPTAAMQQQWRELQEIVGKIILDVLPPLLNFLTDIAKAFNSLSPEMQRLIVYTGLFVAALGPLVTIVGTLIRVAATLTPIIVGLGAALAGISAPVWAIVAAVTAAVAALLIFWRAVGKLLQGDFTAAWEEAKKTARDMWNDLTSMFAKEPIQAPVEFVGPDGKKIAPGKTNFSLPKPDTDTGTRGTFPDEISVTPMQEISPDFWRGMSTEMMNVISFFADRFVGEIQARREKVMTQEETVDLHMRRGEGGFLSDEMMRRLQVARDLEHQQLDAEERLQRLRSDLQQAEIEHDGAKIENLNTQIILEEQLLALIKQTSVEQIRREERLQEAVGTFIDRFESDLMDMLENWNFSLKGLGDAFKKLLFDILVKPHVEAAGEALGQLIKQGIGSIGSSFSGGFAEGGFVPPGQWAVAGERGPEPVFGGKTGLTVMSNEDATRDGAFGGGTTIINQNIRTQDVNSFQRTRRQLARDTKRALQEA